MNFRTIKNQNLLLRVSTRIISKNMDGDKSPSTTFLELYKFSCQIDTLLGIVGTADHEVRHLAGKN